MIRFETVTLVAALCLACVATPSQAQAPGACPCTATNQLTAAQLVTLLGGRMACAQLGSERWQEWHDSATGEVTDYKLGPGNAVDPPKVVGSYAVNADNTVSYTYGGTTYKYAVCPQDSSSLYAFCGDGFGGRDITGVLVGGSALQSCATVTPAPAPSSTGKSKPAPKPGPSVKPPKK